tara:strand:- start:41 stop:412 length:372 start_codon:yes stop_codon:yes gene_type:complete
MPFYAKDIIIYSGSSTGSYGIPSSSAEIARWEVDPDDGKSLQLRIKSGSLPGLTEDKIPFYVSASGRIGIGTKNPTDEVEVKSTNNKFKADFLASITCSTQKVIAYTSVSASSYEGPIDGGTY